MAIWTRKQKTPHRAGGQVHSDAQTSASSHDLEVLEPEVPCSPHTGELPEAKARWLGYVDHVSSTRISGWAYDLRNPQSSVAVEAVSSTGKRAVALANIFRADVLEAGYGDGNSGFDLDLSTLRLTSGTVSVRFVDGGMPITNRPIEMDPLLGVIEGRVPDPYGPMMQMLAARCRQSSADYKALGRILR